MATPFLRIVFALFLIAHGLVTVMMAAVPVANADGTRAPFFPSWWRNNVDNKWPISKMGLNASVVRTIGWVLWLSAAILFVLAGIGLLGISFLGNLWQTPAVIAALISIFFLILYWHPWDFIGMLLNIGIATGVFTHIFTKWFGR